MSALCIQIARNCVMFTPPTYHLCKFWKAIKMPTCTHTGWFISVPLCSGQSELASICLLSNLITNLMYNKEIVLQRPAQVQNLKTIPMKLDNKV